MTITTTDELSAVNTMLGVIGEAPINSLAAISSVIDAVTARAVLNEIAVTVQSEGWQFNTEDNWTFLPDNTGTINIPSSIIEARSYTTEFDLALRGTRLYDRKNHTYDFSAYISTGIALNCTILMEFADLPQAARYYISIRAARVFQNRVVGSDTLKGFTKEDEMYARVALKKYDADSAGYNMLTGTYGVARTLDR